MGFDTERRLFHGTTSDVRGFDPSLTGSRGENYGDATWLTSSPKLASGYAQDASKSGNWNALREMRDNELERARLQIVEMLRSGEKVDFGTAYKNLDATKSAKELTAMMRDEASKVSRGEVPIDGSAVYPAYVRGNIMDFDAQGQHFRRVNADAFESAQDAGFDGVRIRNVVDPPDSLNSDPVDTVAVFDPSNIRSEFAAFDPAKRDSSNLLAGVGGATATAGLVGAGMAPQDAEAAQATTEPVRTRQAGNVRRQGREQQTQQARLRGLEQDLLEDFQRRTAPPRPDAPVNPKIASLANWARAQRGPQTSSPDWKMQAIAREYGTPLESVANMLDSIAYGDYGTRKGFGEYAYDSGMALLEAADPLTLGVLPFSEQSPAESFRQRRAGKGSSYKRYAIGNDLTPTGL